MKCLRAIQLIIPENKLSKGLYMVLEAFAAVFCVILLVTMVFGSIAPAADDEHTSYIGKVMVFVPLGISLVQIIPGLIFRFINKK